MKDQIKERKPSKKAARSKAALVPARHVSVSQPIQPDELAEPGGINGPCHSNTSGVGDHGGHVIGNPRVVLIYWDQYFTNTPAAVTRMSQFATDLVSGSYMDGLSQYGINRGVLAGSTVINMASFPTPNSTHPGIVFSESQMQAQLIDWINQGVVTPAPAGDETSLVYLIFAPSDTTLSVDGITSGFCGYHKHGKLNASGSDDNLFWGTVVGYSKSSSGQTFVDSISFCVSHELNETFSNRDGCGFFSDDGNGCEIGDLCEADGSGHIVTFPYGPWKVEAYWSNAQGTCFIPPWDAPDVDKIWMTVGSAGTLDEASVGKVFFDHGIVQMGKTVVGLLAAEERDSIQPRTQSAVIRYNVTPVDGLFTLSAAPCSPGVPCPSYFLTLRCLAAGSQAQVTADLIEIDMATGVETVRLTFKSTPTSNSYELQSGVANQGPDFSFDFLHKAYYIEATLTASAIALSAAGIQIIKIESGFTPF